MKFVTQKYHKLRPAAQLRSEEHTSELQSQSNLVCRLLLEKKRCPHPQTDTNPSSGPATGLYLRALVMLRSAECRISIVGHKHFGFHITKSQFDGSSLSISF